MSDDNGWVPISPCAPPTVYLPLSGGTMTGPLILAADPIQPLEAVTKQYADAIIAVVEDSTAIGDNRIINGDMRIDQRNQGTPGQTIGYTIDRWMYTATQASKIGWQRLSNATSIASGFPYFLGLITQLAYASLATDQFYLVQRIEADMIGDFQWGTAGAQPVTLSFWVVGSQPGTYSGSIVNDTGTRSYPFSFQVTSNLSKVSITIPGDTVGPWVLTGNAIGMAVRFDLGSGSNSRGPANAWASANYFGVTGTAGIVATLNATLNITGVKLEIGTLATPFNRYSMAKSLADCQRYYQTYSNVIVAGNTVASSGFFETITFPSMRAPPTAVFGTISYTNASALAASLLDTNSTRLQAVATAPGYGSATAPMQLSAEL